MENQSSTPHGEGRSGPPTAPSSDTSGAELAAQGTAAEILAEIRRLSSTAEADLQVLDLQSEEHGFPNVRIPATRGDLIALCLLREAENAPDAEQSQRLIKAARGWLKQEAEDFAEEQAAGHSRHHRAHEEARREFRRGLMLSARLVMHLTGARHVDWDLLHDYFIGSDEEMIEVLFFAFAATGAIHWKPNYPPTHERIVQKIEAVKPDTFAAKALLAIYDALREPFSPVHHYQTNRSIVFTIGDPEWPSSGYIGWVARRSKNEPSLERPRAKVTEAAA